MSFRGIVVDADSLSKLGKTGQLDLLFKHARLFADMALGADRQAIL